ncbi:MAG: hypothetical protein P8X88_02770 [Gammaproteobacteria bacterium]
MTKQESSYSLWLRPTQLQIDELTKIISMLAHRYRRAVFPPHITLLSGIKTNLGTITKVCEQIIEPFPALNIKLDNIAYTDEYFRNLYILAKPEEPLMSLYEDIKKQLNCNSSNIFMPHVSLLYGNLNIKQQRLLSKELTNSYPKVFSCERVDIYNSTGKESEWYLVDSFDFA